MKKILTTVLCLAMLLSATALISCNGGGGGEGYVCIDINPSVELVIDRRDKIIAANALNVDAEIVLSGIELVGLDMADAVELFIEIATELGYIDTEADEDDPNAVLVTTVAVNGKRANAIKAKMLKQIDQYFEDNGIWGIAWSDDDLGTMIEEAEELGISAGKYRLIKAVQISYPEMALEELQNMSIRGLINLAKEKNPADTIVRNYTARVEELQSLESLTDDEQAELDELVAKLDDIEKLREKAAADKEALKENVREKLETFRENRQSRVQNRRGRWQQFRNNHPKISERIVNQFRDEMNR